MQILVFAVAVILAGVVPAQAEPVTATITAVTLYLEAHAAVAAVAQFALSIGLAFVSSLAARGQNKAARQARPKVNITEYGTRIDERSIYGRRVVSGGKFFDGTVASGAGGKDIYVIGLVLSVGQCERLISVIVNGVKCEIDAEGKAATEPWLQIGANYLKTSFRSGSDTQTIDPIILARFPNLEQELRDKLDDQSLIFAQRGYCTVVVEMKYGTDQNHHVELWGNGGEPNIQFEIEGLKLFNPANPGHVFGDPETYEYSNNASLVILNYLMNNSPAATASKFDMDTFIARAKHDDRNVKTIGGFERRNTIDGPVLSSEKYVDVLEAMAFSCAARPYFADGRYGLRGLAGSAPVSTITESKFRDSYKYTNHVGHREWLNALKINFEPASKFNEDGEISYELPDLIASDGGRLEGDGAISLRFITRPGQAQRRAYEIIDETRNGAKLAGLLDISAIVVTDKESGSKRFAVGGDILWLEFKTSPQMSGLYVLDESSLNADFSVSMSFTEHSETTYGGYPLEHEIEFKEDTVNG